MVLGQLVGDITQIVFGRSGSSHKCTSAYFRHLPPSSRFVIGNTWHMAEHMAEHIAERTAGHTAEHMAEYVGPMLPFAVFVCMPAQGKYTKFGHEQAYTCQDVSLQI